MSAHLASPSSVSDKAFDYVIVGGGTAGLVLANRLTEDAGTTVLVLEAGGAHFDDPMTYLPTSFGLGFGKVLGNPEYDWGFLTTPQTHSDSNLYYWARGKGLGGSSSANFYNWERPPKEDIDAWEELGNPGWNWPNYLKYSKKSTKFVPPPEDAVKNEGLTYDLSVHGTDGPVIVSFPKLRPGFDNDFAATLAKLGVQKVVEPNSGARTGLCFDLSTIDPATNKRSSSSSAYLEPVLGRRPNLTVVVNAPATGIASRTDGNELVATGVTFVVDGKEFSVGAKKEVILSAGALKTPQLLELSGIGDPAILEKLGVDVKLALPTVGTNVQDHLFAGLSYELTDAAAAKFHTVDPLGDPATAEEHLKLYERGEGLFTLGCIGILMNTLSNATDAPESVTRLAPSVKASGDDAPGRAEQYAIMRRALERDEQMLEVMAMPGFFSLGEIPAPGKKHISLCGTFNRPFSRGTIHAGSVDPLAPPEMDPHYLEEKFDEAALMAQVRFIRRIARTEPLASHIAREAYPGADLADDSEELARWVRKRMTTVHHVIGSTAMLPRDKGGVVDAQLKVYGTRNLRVVDAGVIPLHFSAHPQATVYALAEQAADIIKGVFKV